MGRSHVVVCGYRRVYFVIYEDFTRWEMRIRRSVFAGGSFRGFLVVVALQLKNGNPVRINFARDTHAVERTIEITYHLAPYLRQSPHLLTFKNRPRYLALTFK
jgi:hypothetical protein